MDRYERLVDTLIHAAQVLLERRHDGMVTPVEWDALKGAADAADRAQPKRRQEGFLVEGDCLIRRVVPRRGTPYEHVCTIESYREVLYTIEEVAEGGVTIDDLVKQTDLPHTQVAVALSFLKDRGLLETRRRRNFPADAFLFEDGMIELHALGEEQHQ
jgi:DNA-binding transcriptional ArsR family regulator